MATAPRGLRLAEEARVRLLAEVARGKVTFTCRPPGGWAHGLFRVAGQEASARERSALLSWAAGEKVIFPPRLPEGVTAEVRITEKGRAVIREHWSEWVDPTTY